ncbi:uncharacterized protein [Typha angustifolia]|uniref:uncharacterized protein n=1 Tax=Typha angustifolia TaxID=59011 RepID=UPI003C301E1E
MALSFHSTWDPLCHLNAEIDPLHEHQSEVADALAGFFSDPFDSSNLLIDSLFESQPDTTSTLNHSSLSAPSMLSLPHSSHQPCQDFDVYRCPKCPRSCGDLYNPCDLMFEANSYAGPVTGTTPELLPEFVASQPGKKANGGCLSAQSVAARERRKRISEKTQELGKLIPGGNKMNTAEMFQAAFKYVKFLQAQVGILGLMGSNVQENKAAYHGEEQLQLLLGSTNVQEKLYGEGKCLVPKELVETSAKDQDVKSNPLISRDLDRFIESVSL